MNPAKNFHENHPERIEMPIGKTPAYVTKQFLLGFTSGITVKNFYQDSSKIFPCDPWQIHQNFFYYPD